MSEEAAPKPKQDKKRARDGRPPRTGRAGRDGTASQRAAAGGTSLARLRDTIREARARRMLAFGAAPLLLGIALVAIGDSPLGMGAALAGLALLVVGIHTFGRLGAPAARPQRSAS